MDFFLPHYISNDHTTHVEIEGYKMFYFDCPYCERRIQVAQAASGKSGKCPGCKNVIIVPCNLPSLASEGSAPAESQIADCNGADEYRVAPIHDSQPNVAIAAAESPKTNSPSLIRSAMQEQCEYCKRRNTVQHQGRLWCASCNDWAQGERGNVGCANSTAETEDLFEQAKSGKHLSAFALSMVTTAFAGPVAGHAAYEAALRNGTKSNGSAPTNSQLHSAAQKAQPRVCAKCDQRVESIHLTCPNCGHTLWSIIIVLAVASAAFLAAGWLAFDWANNSDAKLPSRICVGVGLLGLFVAAGEMVYSLMHRNTKRQS